MHAKRLGSSLLDLVYPRVCAGCGAAVTDRPGHVCWDCLAALEWVRAPVCRMCGDPVQGRVEHAYACAACTRHPPAFALARSAVRYRGPLKPMLQAFKYARQTCLARDFAEMMHVCAQVQFAGERFDAVTCVPLHSRKQRERTYNQSRLLARRLARSLRVPWLGGLLVRVKPTATQTGLGAARRRSNVSRAFCGRQREWIEGRSLLLVDDVMTTGATLHECARTLRQCGARSVCALTLARG